LENSTEPGVRPPQSTVAVYSFSNDTPSMNRPLNFGSTSITTGFPEAGGRRMSGRVIDLVPAGTLTGLR